jgi:hypothetical protein
MTVVQPTGEQEERPKWHLLLTNIEWSQDHLRQLRTFEPWKLMFSGMTAGAAFFGAERHKEGPAHRHRPQDRSAKR